MRLCHFNGCIQTSRSILLAINKFDSYTVRAHCCGDFFVCCSKPRKDLTMNLFANIKLLLDHREKNMKWFLRARINVLKSVFSHLSEIHRRNGKKLVNCSPFPPQPCAAKDEWNHLLCTGRVIVNKTETFTWYKYVLWPFKATLQIGDTAPLMECSLQHN